MCTGLTHGRFCVDLSLASGRIYRAELVHFRSVVYQGEEPGRIKLLQ